QAFILWEGDRCLRDSCKTKPASNFLSTQLPQRSSRWQPLPLSSSWVETLPPRSAILPERFSKFEADPAAAGIDNCCRLEGEAQAFNSFKERNESCSENS